MKKLQQNLPEETIHTWVQLMRASTALLDKIEDSLKAKSLPPLSWYDALLEIKRAGTDGLRPYHLQEQMLLAQYNLSRLLDRLEKENLIERRPCEKDGRGQILFITKEGRSTLRKMWPVYQSALDTHFQRKLSKNEIVSLSRILTKLR